MMNYFIESVNTYSSTGKSAKGRILQKVVAQYEHKVFDQDSIEALHYSLDLLVKMLNKELPGKPLILSRNTDSISGGGYMSCSDGGATGTDVFIIHYVPVLDRVYASYVRSTIYSVLYDDLDEKEIARLFGKVCYEDSEKKGGER